MTEKECTECSLNIQEMFGLLFILFYDFYVLVRTASVSPYIVLEADGSFIDVNMFLRLFITAV